MNKFKKIILISFATILTLGVAGSVYVVSQKPADVPFSWSWVEDKLESIIVPKPPLDNGLTPTRDLRGAWISSLPGKGFQVYGRFEVPGSVTTVYENGDIELIIDEVKDNVAVGKIRLFNMAASGQTVAPPPVGTINIPPQQFGDAGFQPISIKVSATALDFGSVYTGDFAASMQGTYTSDMIAGTMGIETPYGIAKGTFNLMRKK